MFLFVECVNYTVLSHFERNLLYENTTNRGVIFDSPAAPPRPIWRSQSDIEAAAISCDDLDVIHPGFDLVRPFLHDRCHITLVSEIKHGYDDLARLGQTTEEREREKRKEGSKGNNRFPQTS